MKYERHTPQFDNIVEIEPIDPAWFAEKRFHRRIDKMEADALEKIDSMVNKAKRKMGLIPDPLEVARSNYYGQLGFLLGMGDSTRQELARQQQLGLQGSLSAGFSDYRARQQQSWNAASPFGRLMGGIFG